MPGMNMTTIKYQYFIHMNIFMLITNSQTNTLYRSLFYSHDRILDSSIANRSGKFDANLEF